MLPRDVFLTQNMRIAATIKYDLQWKRQPFKIKMKENSLPVLIHVQQSEYENINAAEQGMYDEICHVNYEWNGNYFGLVATGNSTFEHEKSIFSYFYKREWLFILVYVGSHQNGK